MIEPRVQTLRFKADAAAGAVSEAIWRAPFGCTIVGVYGYRIGGTSATVNALIGATNVLTADKSLTTASAFMAGTLDPTKVHMNAGDVLTAALVTAVGTPTSVRIQVDVVFDSDAR